MRIIDRYVLRQFLQAFVICYISLTGLFVVFDAFANLDEFMRYSERHGNLLKVMGEFYSYRAVFFFDRVHPAAEMSVAIDPAAASYRQWVFKGTAHFGTRYPEHKVHGTERRCCVHS